MNAETNTLFTRGKEVLMHLEQNGYQAYFVGGCVRDRLLQRPVSDIDLCTSAKPHEVMGLFSTTIPTGIQHGTVSVIWKGIPFEVTTFRSEGVYNAYRRPAHVQFEASLKVDLQRRDFTINSMAMDKDEQLIDFVGGKADLEQRIIRTVGQAEQRFQEDALRMFRALRFSAQLGFSIEQQTYEQIKVYRALLLHVAQERISVEFQKIMSAQWPEIGLRELVATGIAYDVYPFPLIIPAIKALDLHAVTQLNEEERWILLLRMIQDRENAYAFLRHQVLPRELSKQIKHRLKALYAYPKHTQASHFTAGDLLELGLETAQLVLKLNRYREVIRKNNAQVDVQNEPQHELDGYRGYAAGLQQELARLEGMFTALPIHHKRDVALSGKDLMALFPLKKEGPWIQRTLDHLLDLVLSGQIENQREALIAYLLECEQNEQ